MPAEKSSESSRPPTVGGVDVGALIRRVRRTAQVSQRELAKRAGVSPAQVGNIEAGRVLPSLRTLERLLFVADYRLVAVDLGGRLVAPLEVYQGVHDLAGRRFPAHLDLIIDPVYGEWWADVYGLQRPPETFQRRSSEHRDWQRRQSRWEVRVAQLRDDPEPHRPRDPKD